MNSSGANSIENGVDMNPEALSIGSSQISRVDRRADLQLSTLWI